MSDKDLLALAMTRQKIAEDAMSDSREDELDDLRFMAASPDNQWQWPSDVLATRGANQGNGVAARPCITINKLPQHVRQVTNDQRQNRPTAKIIPVDDDADVEVADILNGVVRHIDYISDSDIAYDTACDNQVTFGEGYFRILTDFCDEHSFDQDIKIGRIRNSFSVYMDPMIQDPCGSDAQWCLITQDMLVTEFEAEYPKATPISSIMQQGVGNSGIAQWITEKTVRVAEYYYFEDEEITLLQLQDGKVTTQAEYDKAFKDAESPPQVKNKRTSTIRHVKWCKINGYEVLERKDWAGKWIPVIRVVGNEYEVDGQMVVSGLVRNAKDAQRMYNYWTSQEAEMLALAPKAPFIAYGGQFEGYEEQWKTANVNNWPYLEVNGEVTDHEGRPLPLPQRAQPPLAQSGLLQAKLGAADDIKGTTGQYDSSLGAESTEKSGKAIIAREKQGDVGTYHYVDNLSKAIRFGTRQIIDLIPKIYDTKRIARIIGLDGEVSHVQVDPSLKMPMVKIHDQQTGATIKTIYNFGIGQYDVMATTGPSYMTKRQEMVEAMNQMLQGAKDPQVALVTLYFAAKNMDFDGAPEFAAAVKKLVQPGILDDGEDDPEVMKLKQTVQGQQQTIQQLHQTMQKMVESVDASKIENEEFKADIDAYSAITGRLKVFADKDVDDTAVIAKTNMDAMKINVSNQRTVQ